MPDLVGLEAKHVSGNEHRIAGKPELEPEGVVVDGLLKLAQRPPLIL